MSNELRIAVSGKSGCGNTTVSRLLAERLNIRLINYTFHDMAAERGMTFEELCRQAEEDSQYDLYLDRKQVELAAQGSCVLGSRLAIWLLAQADLKIYLDASVDERAKRRYLQRVERGEDVELEKILKKLEKRDKKDSTREIAPLRAAPDAVVINTDSLTIPEVVTRIEEIVQESREE